MDASQHGDQSQANALLLQAAREGQLLGYITAMVHANIEHDDENGDTALIIAAGEGHLRIVEQLLVSGARVDHENRDGFTALLSSARNGHLKVVEELLQKNASALHRCRNGNNALHYAVLGGHDDVARELLRHGADPSQPNNGGEPAGALISRGSALFSEFAIHQQYEKLAETWRRALDEGITREQLLSLLQSSYLISSFESFLLTHNLLLLSIRQGVVGMAEASMFQGNRDFLLERIYLPVSRLDLSPSERFFVWRIVHHAEELSLIQNGHGAMVRLAAEMRSEIRENRQQLQSELICIVRKIGSLDERVNRLEDWAAEFENEFGRLCNNQSLLLDDMKRMNVSLHQLHSNLQRTEKYRKYSAIVSLVLAAVPVVGGVLGGASAFCSELLLGFNAEDMFAGASAVAEQTSPSFAEVDLSNFRIAGALVSRSYLALLPADDRERIECVVRHSPFGTVERLETRLNETAEQLGEDELDMITSNRDGELRQRFRLLATRANVDTANAYDAAVELHTFLRSSADIHMTLEDVLHEVVQELDNEGRITSVGFLRAYSELGLRHRTNSERAVPRELRERFMAAVAPNSKLPVVVAKHILKVLFFESGRRSMGRSASSSRLSFRRVETEWDEEHVAALFEEISGSESTVNEAMFVEVSMKVLFQMQ